MSNALGSIQVCLLSMFYKVISVKCFGIKTSTFIKHVLLDYQCQMLWDPYKYV